MYTALGVLMVLFAIWFVIVLMFSLGDTIENIKFIFLGLFFLVLVVGGIYLTTL